MNDNFKEGKHFKEWVDKINVDSKALKYVLDVGFNNGVIDIILKNCKEEWNSNHIPIRCFAELSGIYVFDLKCWRLISDKEFKEIICLIQRIGKIILKTFKYCPTLLSTLQTSMVLLEMQSDQVNCLKETKKLTKWIIAIA